MISGTECGLFAIRSLLIWLLFGFVAPKSAETLPFTLVREGHSNNRHVTLASAAAAYVFLQGQFLHFTFC